MTYILAFDQGTTSSRAMLFDDSGKLVHLAQAALQQHFPQNGYVEHDAMEIWESQLHVAQQVLRQANVPAHAVSAIGITNQRETTVLWDRQTGQPLARAIVWQDRRTAETCRQLVEDGHESLIQNITGLVPDAYFSATKLKWLLDNVEGARERAERGELAFGTIDTWLLWNLTGGQAHLTDVSNASRTLLFNIHTLQWDEMLLELFDIPPEVLPEVRPNQGLFGHTQTHLFGHAIAVTALLGDQQAATFGQTCFEPGMLKSTFGTGCFMLLNTGQKAVQSTGRLLTTIGWQLQPKTDPVYCLEGSIFMAGATIQWLRDGLNLIGHTKEIEPLATSVADTDDVFLVPALTGLGAPHWDPHARGLLIGMSRGTTRAHIARAALESIALQVSDVLDAMCADAPMEVSQLRVDGAAAQNDLLMQMQANFCGRPVYRPQVTETTAQGVAYMAGLAGGIWPDLESISDSWQLERVFEPQWSQDQRQSHLARWHQAVARSRHWIDAD